MFYKALVLVFGISVSFLGCSTGKKAPNSSTLNRPVQSAYTAGDTGIVFVIMKIYTDSLTHSNKILIQDKIYTTGRVKDHSVGFNHSGSTITCILYEGNKAIDSVRLEHPLHKHVEYLDANNQMGMKEVHLQEAEFSVRFQLKGQGNKIKVLESINRGKKTQELKMIPL